MQNQVTAICHRTATAYDYGTVARNYNRNLYGVTSRILRNRADAEDAVQDAHVNALLHLHQFSGRSALSTWTMRIAANQALCGLRRRRVKFVDVTALPLAAGGRDPEQEAARTQLRDDILAAVQTLPKDYRVVFVLRVLLELGAADTAARLDLTVGCVKTRLHRAKALLRQKLGPSRRFGRTDANPNLSAVEPSTPHATRFLL